MSVSVTSCIVNVISFLNGRYNSVERTLHPQIISTAHFLFMLQETDSARVVLRVTKIGSPSGEMVDTLCSERSSREAMGVQVPPRALKIIHYPSLRCNRKSELSAST